MTELKKSLPSARLLYYDNPAVAANRRDTKALNPEDDPDDPLFIHPSERNEMSAMKWWARMHRRQEMSRRIETAVLD